MAHNSNFPEIIYKLGGPHSFAVTWRFNPEFYRLMGSLCEKCGKRHWPRRYICPECGSRELKNFQLNQTGVIEAIGPQTHHYKTGYDDILPQVHAIIKLDDGPHIEAEVVGISYSYMKDLIINPKENYDFYDNLIGKRVRMVTRRLRKSDNGNASYGYKFTII